MTHHRNERRIRRTALARALPALCSVTCAVACSDADINLGDGGLIQRDLSQTSRCSDSTRVLEDVFVTNQAEMEALTGCEEIDGRLTIDIFADADLAPLASLRRVSSYFELGVMPRDIGSDSPEEAELEALMEAGFLPSLHGLESLERVGNMQLNFLLVADLTELESLRTIDESLFVYEAKNLTSLAGLEAVHAPRLELAQCRALTTLTGFTFPEAMDSLRLDTLPALSDMGALAETYFVGDLMLSATGLRALPELALQGATFVTFKDNPELLDVGSLRTLNSVRALELTNNPKLSAFPSMPDLGGLDTLIVVGNGIESLTLDVPLLQLMQRTVVDRNLELPGEDVVIASNPNLSSIRIPGGHPSVQYFAVYDNASLRDLELAELQHADLFVIDGNPLLDRVTASSLVTVNRLEITNNPNLVPAGFDAVRTFERSISGNATP